MFNTLSPYLRLFFCLLLSTGVHGGMAWFDWIKMSGEGRPSAAPVTVALLSVADIAPPGMVLSPVPQKDPQPARKTARTSTSPRQLLKAKAPADVAATPKTLPKKQLASVVSEKPRTDAPAAEMVCMVPQDVATRSDSAVSAEHPPAMLSTGTAEASAAHQAVAANAIAGGIADALQDLVDAVPNYSSNPLPEYPTLARQKHWQGVVWLLVDVSMQGEVDDLVVEQSCGHSVLDRAATRTVRRWRFTPAKRAGQPTASQVRIPVRFRLEDS
jgi:protein TonB